MYKNFTAVRTSGNTPFKSTNEKKTCLVLMLSATFHTLDFMEFHIIVPLYEYFERGNIGVKPFVWFFLFSFSTSGFENRLKVYFPNIHLRCCCFNRHMKWFSGLKQVYICFSFFMNYYYIYHLVTCIPMYI